jgi:hypothetical protein
MAFGNSLGNFTPVTG